MSDPMKSPDRDATDERTEAIVFANRILDRVNADPDDDVAVLARQFLRSEERAAELATLRRRDEQGWLIEVAESGQESAGGPIYWCGPGTWFRDHSLAIRFARREDAERVMPMAEEERRKTLHTQERLIAVQHGWASPLPPGRNEG